MEGVVAEACLVEGEAAVVVAYLEVEFLEEEEEEETMEDSSFD